MKITFNVDKKTRIGSLTIQREPGDSRMSTESQLLYHLKNALNERGFDLIKKRIQKDGHMMGDERMQYLRSRNKNDRSGLQIYAGDYALTQNNLDYNKYDSVRFEVEPRWRTTPMNEIDKLLEDWQVA